MLAEPLDLKATAVQSLGSRYRREGYEVVVEPGQSELPEPLRPFRPDLLARRGDELVVAEVVRRRTYQGHALDLRGAGPLDYRRGLARPFAKAALNLPPFASLYHRERAGEVATIISSLSIAGQARVQVLLRTSVTT